MLYINENMTKIKISCDKIKTISDVVLAKLINKNVIKNKAITSNYYIICTIIIKKRKELKS